MADEDPISPHGEIKVITDTVQLVEVYQPLSVERWDLEVVQRIFQFLNDRPPVVLHNIHFSYHRESLRGDPDFLLATITMGELE